MRIAVCIAGGARTLPVPAADELWVAARQSVALPAGARPAIAEEGVWRARNRVLEETDADVVAFLDHDVAFEQGWLERLRRAWDEAGPAVAAIGGPIALAGTPEPPAWLATALALQDLGPERLELDPAERTLHGGNLSFRTWQLAAAGGFRAQFDGREQRDWFGEEHEAQRELGRWGWRTVYEPRLRAERAADPGARELLRGRARYGTRVGRLGRRGRVEAARQGLTSLAGLGPALARRQRQTALERSARAAENLAAAFARRVPEAPAGVATGAAATVEARGARGRRSRTGDHGALVLLYHRVTERSPDPLALCVRPDHFEAHLAVLAETSPVVPLAELAAGDAPAGAVAISFDDGYADNLHEALPRLRAAGLPATVFAATGHIASGRGFFWDAITHALHDSSPLPPELTLEIGGERRSWPVGSAAEREQARYDLHHLLQPRSPEVIAAVLEQLGARDHEADLPVSKDGLRELAEDVDVGAHTRRHVSLRFQPPGVQRAEIEGSRDDVLEWTGRRPTGFSYPFGIPGRDFVPRTAQLVEEAGFHYAVGNNPGLVTGATDRFAIPRFVPPDAGREEFARWLTKVRTG